MGTIGRAVRQAMRTKRWSYQKLAERASKLPGAPDISRRQVMNVVNSRTTIRLDDPAEPLRYILPALGLGAEVVVEALGLREGGAA